MYRYYNSPTSILEKFAFVLVATENNSFELLANISNKGHPVRKLPLILMMVVALQVKISCP